MLIPPKSNHNVNLNLTLLLQPLISFYRAKCTYSADCAVARWPSVCLSYAGIVWKRLNIDPNIIIKLFHYWVATPFWFFFCTKHSNGDLRRPHRMQWGMKNGDFRPVVRPILSANKMIDWLIWFIDLAVVVNFQMACRSAKMTSVSVRTEMLFLSCSVADGWVLFSVACACLLARIHQRLSYWNFRRISVLLLRSCCNFFAKLDHWAKKPISTHTLLNSVLLSSATWRTSTKRCAGEVRHA